MRTVADRADGGHFGGDLHVRRARVSYHYRLAGAPAAVGRESLLGARDPQKLASSPSSGGERVGLTGQYAD